MAAIRSLGSFLGQDCLSAVAVLRPFHTGGMMPWLRAFFTGGRVLPTTAGALGGKGLQPPGQALLSLVPAQLYEFLKTDAANWSRGLKAILLGGAPAGKELLRRASELGLPLMPCYGMTETAGLVAAQPVGEWHPDSPPVGRLLPGNSAEIDGNGQILLRSAALFTGYGDEPQRIISQWPTGDRGYIDPLGRLAVTGRLRPWINSGGKKVAPDLIEAALSQTFPGREARVIPLPDPKWGEVVAVVMTGAPIDVDTLRTSLRTTLPVEGLPRILKCVDTMPVDERGKITEQALRAVLADQQ